VQGLPGCGFARLSSQYGQRTVTLGATTRTPKNRGCVMLVTRPAGSYRRKELSGPDRCHVGGFVSTFLPGSTKAGPVARCQFRFWLIIFGRIRKSISVDG